MSTRTETRLPYTTRFRSELIWATRKPRAKAEGRTIDWIVVRNRLQHVDAHNMRRVGEALNQLSRRVGLRVIPGLGERVIYRELFPAGLTLLAKAHLDGMGMGHIVARQGLRASPGGLTLPSRERLHPDGDLFAVARHPLSTSPHLSPMTIRTLPPTS